METVDKKAILSHYKSHSSKYKRSAKARFGQVGDQISHVKDQVGKGQGQEIDNIALPLVSIKHMIDPCMAKMRSADSITLMPLA